MYKMVSNDPIVIYDGYLEYELLYLDMLILQSLPPY